MHFLNSLLSFAIVFGPLVASPLLVSIVVERGDKRLIAEGKRTYSRRSSYVLFTVLLTLGTYVLFVLWLISYVDRAAGPSGWWIMLPVLGPAALVLGIYRLASRKG